MRYRRNYQTGGRYFFTVVTSGRRPWLGDACNIDLLLEALRQVRKRYPFTIDGIVILPDHLHTIWTLPTNDAGYSLRWRLIKTHVSKRSAQPAPLWQSRFWEHTIRDERDYAQHMDYIHYNPVKHGLAGMPRDWPYSSFARCVDEGIYASDWGGVAPSLSPDIGHE